MQILIDNGHGSNTPGKCSPDRRLLEYAYTRDIARRIVEKLTQAGYQAERIVTEEKDISLRERCRRVNDICHKCGTNNVILISIHCNAAPPNDGKWHTARGWSAHVSLNASFKSKQLARHLAAAAKECGLKVREYSRQIPYWAQNLAICRDTKCPAVLTENLFQDNRDDVDFLLSELGRATIAKVNTLGIINYLKDITPNK